MGLSGGVDSAVASLVLQQMGYEVTGIFLHLYAGNHPRSCCSLEASSYAKRNAEALGISLYIYNAQSAFQYTVVDFFQRGYQSGQTPNPCIECNRFIRFPILFRQAQAIGAEFVATGHYARIQYEPGGGHYFLYRGYDFQKDQSYFLYSLQADMLSRLIFPLGRMKKEEVIEIAKRNQLPCVEKLESQDLCFFMGNVSDFFPETTMQVVTEENKLVGTYRGRLFLTPGQRKGLGISGGERFYVLEVNAEKGFIRVGKKEHLEASALEVQRVNWLIPDPPAQLEAEVQHRYRAEGVPALIKWDGERATVEFEKKIWAPAVGQSAVFYQNCRVLGGGIISRILR